MDNIIPDNPRKIVGRAVITNQKAPEPIRTTFSGVYEVVLDRRWWVPIRKRVKLKNVESKEKVRVEYGILKVFFELVPQVDSEQLYQKVLNKINKKQ